MTQDKGLYDTTSLTPAHSTSSPAPIAVPPKTAAAMLSICLSGFYALLNEGQIASCYIGRSRRVPVASLQDFLQRRLAAAGHGGTSPTPTT